MQKTKKEYYHLNQGFSNCGLQNKLAFCALWCKTLRIPVVLQNFLKKLV